MIRWLSRSSRAIALILLGGALGYWLSDGITDLRQMFTPPAPKTSAAAAWEDFSARIQALGERILKDLRPEASPAQPASATVPGDPRPGEQGGA